MGRGATMLAKSWHGLGREYVLRICVTEATVPAQGSHTLLNGREPTILAAEASVICAPRIILCLRAGADPGCHKDDCQHKKQHSHG
jgi:hypothetical protein